MSLPKVYAPNVHLFAYNLRKIYRDADGKKTDNIQELFVRGESILQEFGINQPIKIQDRPGYRVELLKEQTEDNASIFFEGCSHCPITGIAYPVLIHDTCALALNVRRPEKNQQGEATEKVDLNFFKRLHPNDCWMPKADKSSLGQTLLLTVWYNPEKTWPFGKSRQNQKDLKTLADGCLRSFIPDKLATPPFFQAGELFGSPIFEYVEYGIPEQVDKYCHVLVWIFCTSETDIKFQEQYYNFLDLFYHRNKILQAYKLSRDVYKVLSADYDKIEPEIAFLENLPEDQPLKPADFQNLKRQLKRLPRLDFDFANLLRELEIYYLTLEINAQNYERELKQFQKQDPKEDLTFLATFSDQYRIFQEQIQADLRYLSQGSGLLEKSINTIRGRLEIEQAESAQQLQNTIQALGAGIGAGVGTAGILATSYPLIEKEWKLPSTKNPILPPHPFLMSLLLSFIFGAVTGCLIWRFTKDHLDKKLPQNSSSNNQRSGATPSQLYPAQTPKVSLPSGQKQKQNHSN